CDGYDHSTLYHHLNMGWAGLDDAWYNLPNVDTTSRTYDAVTGCIYNIYTEGSGEIISGRVTDSAGVPIAGAVVTASLYTAVTDAKGLYALAPVPSNTSFTVQVRKDGYLFADRYVTTGYSQSGGINAGNLWGIDLVGYEPVSIADAKSNPDGVTVGIANAVVTAVFNDRFYVQSPDRTSGIQVIKPAHGLLVNQRVELIGTTGTDADGERYIEASYVRANS
ncbi:MAG: carboxypeptidase-like regulatory domain-containing protein, partial [Armatimonadota bacterium]